MIKILSVNIKKPKGLPYFFMIKVFFIVISPTLYANFLRKVLKFEQFFLLGKYNFSYKRMILVVDVRKKF